MRRPRCAQPTSHVTLTLTLTLTVTLALTLTLALALAHQALHRESDAWKAGLRMPTLSYRRVASTKGLYVVPNVYREHAVCPHRAQPSPSP